MYHCKVMIVDSLLVSVGSTNFDNRSFQLNDEANLNVYDAGAAVGGREIDRPPLERVAPRSGFAVLRSKGAGADRGGADHDVVDVQRRIVAAGGALVDDGERPAF